MRLDEASLALGEIVCCSEDGLTATQTDAEGQCLSGDWNQGDRTMHTYYEAVETCQSMSMRLCASQEELDRSCCGGCLHDHVR